MQFDVKVISSNCDFMFDMFFKDAKALEDFSTSPEHLAVVASLKPYMTGAVVWTLNFSIDLFAIPCANWSGMTSPRL